MADSSDFSIDENGVLTAYSGSGGKVIIPEGVVKIADEVFSNNQNITSVEFPDSLQEIGASAFASSGLTSVTIPANVTLNNSIFSESALQSVNFEEGVTVIPSFTFRNCKNLSQVTFPSSLREINSWSFGDCSALKSVNIPNGVTFMGNSAFCGAGMIELYIPGSVKTIQQAVFSLCPNLKEVVIGEGVTSISNFAFGNCPELRRITFPESMSVINSAGMFADSNNLVVIKFLSRNPQFPRGEDFFGDYEPIKDGIIDPTVYGYKGTQAETLALKANLVFVPLTEEDGDLVDSKEDLENLPPVDVPTIVVTPNQTGGLTFEQEKNANKNNTIVYNVHLRDEYDGKPIKLLDECILCFPYPEGLDENSANKYRIIIHHYAGNGKTEVFKSEDGDIKFTKQGLCIRVSSFSPFEIEWRGDEQYLPKTGDNSRMILWMLLLVISGVSMLKLKRKTA